MQGTGLPMYATRGGAVNVAISNERLTRFGLVSMIDYYTERSVTCQVD